VKASHAFSSDPLDCAETGPKAYEDISELLKQLMELMGTSPADGVVYDPYFCAGAVVRRLGRLGFEQVVNRNEDFYQVQNEGRVPKHDIVVTNPPYSGDHVARMCDFLVRNNKPFLCLVPVYVLHHPAWRELVGCCPELCLKPPPTRSEKFHASALS